MSTKKGLVGKILSGLLLVGGVVLLVTGGIAWNMTSTELTGQKIDVSGNKYELDGKEVPKDLTPNYANGPFDALSQINLIKLHTKHTIEGMGFPASTVYADVPMPDSADLAACKAGTSDKSASDCKKMITDDAARSFFDNSNSKQASLYTSVMAYGVSALVIGLGIVLLIIGALEFMRFGTKNSPTAPKQAAERQLVNA